MKTIRVVAAVIKAENEKEQPVIFATQRGYGELKEDGNSPVARLRKGKHHRKHLREKLWKNLIRKSLLVN